MASKYPADFRFGDTLRLKEPVDGYETIKIMYLGEAHQPGITDRIIWGIYLADNRAPGRVSTFYAHSYEVVDG